MQASPANLPRALADHPKFRIVRQLGQGGMGTVYLAEHKVMERPVAIKVISRALLDHPDALKRFFAEVRAAAKLNHPNIVAAYDAEPADDLHLLVMEYVEGMNLAEYLEQKGPLPIEHACIFARQTALGLQHAHEQGMVHRDIKPQNLMLTKKGQVKILDFGLARLASEQQAGKGITKSNAFMGTPEFVAPEQATDAREADIRADIYSLGCTLYALLTGHAPFEGGTAVQLILAHLEKTPEPLETLRPEVPPELSALVSRMLAKKPDERFATPGEVAQALAPFCRKGAERSGATLPVAPPVPPPLPGITPPPQNTFADLDAAPRNTTGQTVAVSESRPSKRKASPRGSRKIVVGGAAFAASAIVLGLGTYIATRPGPTRLPQPNQTTEQAKSSDGGKAAVQEPPSPQIRVGQVWKGTNADRLEGVYPASLTIHDQTGSDFRGTLAWTAKSTGDVEALVRGSVKGNELQFKTYQVVRGTGVLSPVAYSGTLNETKASGTWQHVGGRFQRGTFQYSLLQDDGSARPMVDNIAKTVTPRPTLDPALRQLTPGSLTGRLPAHRNALLLEAGGTAESEAAVARGLAWIVKQQQADGSWKLAGYDPGLGSFDEKNVGATAMALLPLLGAGQTPQNGPHQGSVARGIDFLIGGQKSDGDLGGGLYAHPLAATALCEAFALTRDPKLQAAAQKAIDFCVAAQSPAGGWRYLPRSADSDTSVTGWHYLALQTGRAAGLTVPDRALTEVSRYLDSVEDAANGGYGYTQRLATPSCSAIGLLCRLYEGWKPDDPRVQRGIAFLRPDRFADSGNSVYLRYYVTQCLRHAGGDGWRQWQPEVFRWLLQTQEPADSLHAGSWAPRGRRTSSLPVGKLKKKKGTSSTKATSATDAFASAGGRLMTTSLALLMLQSPYRHVPLFYRQMD